MSEPSPIASQEGTTANGTTTLPPTSTATAPQPLPIDPFAAGVSSVVTSEIGIPTLLNRLKQSIASAREFAAFLKKRSSLEEEHANGLRKTCRLTHENMRRPEHRQGSFAVAYDELTRIHDVMADNGLRFSSSLQQMHDDLVEMAANVERGRKQWKQTGMSAEQKQQDTETAMRKSRSKYDSVAEDYDRARTGDKQSGRVFGIKGPKSAAQHEDDLHKKVVAADADYVQKVQSAQAGRAELLSRSRPEAIKNLIDLTKECDSALTLQMQKFASLNERLLLQNGMAVSPIDESEGKPAARSLREAIAAIDNDRDMNYYIASFTSKVPAKPAEIRYERNSVLNPPAQSMQSPPQAQRAPESTQSYNSRQASAGPSASPAMHSSSLAAPSAIGQNLNGSSYPNSPLTSHSPNLASPATMGQRQDNRSFSQPPAPTSVHDRNASMGQNAIPGGPSPQYNSLPGRSGAPNHTYNSQSLGRNTMMGSSGPPQLSSLPFQNNPRQVPQQSLYGAVGGFGQAAPPIALHTSNLPPVKPVFGMTLEQLFERDGSAVPMIVYQCILAVDTFGLEVEGIYRLSGTSTHVQKIKAMFDNDASRVDFTNPENFFHDVNSVSTLLKQFFRDLPDPLLTGEHYQSFIDSAKIDDPTQRRDSLHATINALPDPNYATLRALTLHLNRVQENSSTNRMNASNLALIFGPTLMGGGGGGGGVGGGIGGNLQDSAWQARVIETILSNTYQIFDDD